MQVGYEEFDASGGFQSRSVVGAQTHNNLGTMGREIVKAASNRSSQEVEIYPHGIPCHTPCQHQ